MSEPGTTTRRWNGRSGKKFWVKPAPSDYRPACIVVARSDRAARTLQAGELLLTPTRMPSALPVARRAHADPCDPAYRVYCPQCEAWVMGAQVLTPVDEVAGRLAVYCPQCATKAPGRFDPEMPLPFGAYSGRPIRTLTSAAELAVLDQLLLLRQQGSVQLPQALHLAILWRLGWLDAARQQVAPGPDVEAYRQVLTRLQDKSQEQRQRELREQQAQERQAKEQAAWAARLREEAERQRQREEHYRAREVRTPVGADTSRWLRALGLTPPVTRQLVRQAYYQLSKELHPDRGGDVQQMQLLNQAKAEADAWFERGE